MRFNYIYGLLLTLPLIAFTACGDDNDDDDTGGAGRGGSTSAGASGRAGSGTVGDAGSESGGASTGGRAGTGGGGASGGAFGEAGEGGVGGAEAGSAGEGGSGGEIAFLTDGEILKVLTTVNSGEIAAAQVAQPAAQATAVKNYAAMMITEHSTANGQTLALVSSKHIAPTPSDLSMHLEAEGAALLVTLSQIPSANFDKVYMQTQLQMHAEVLGKIDTQLIPSASDPDVKALLVTIRASVAMHHDMAQTILDAL